MTFSSKTFLAAIATAYLSCFGSAFSSSAATATVLVDSSGLVFTPVTTNIAAGDQVIWTWGGLNHSTTSDTNGLWDSGIASSPHSFTNQFNSSGTFPYHCTLHASFGMRGSIIVAAPNVPPSVAITNPVSGTVFIARANVTVQASASDSDGTVTNVQFRIGATVLTNKTTAPFSAVTNNLPAGSYTFSAIASDNNGVKATNAVTVSVVTPVPVSLTAPQRLSATNFQFSYSANVGLNYVVQRSTNLLSTNWVAIITNTAGSSSMIFVDSNATLNPGFYRVGRLPNP